MYSQSDGSDRKIISKQTDYRRICHLPSHNSKGKKPYGFFPFFDCRDDRTRTGDPYVPNVVRYQLRYIPITL